MLDSFPAMLRALRRGNRLGLRALARRTSLSESHLSNIENGTRVATEEVAIACDAALGTTPLLLTALSIEKGNAMLRRVLFGGTLGIAGGALMANVDTTAALAATINAALRSSTGDWDAIADDFTRRYVLTPGPDFGPEVAAQVMIAHQAFVDGSADAGRAAAQLTMIYALWVGDAGKLGTAHSLYATAAALADSGTDRHLQGWVRARAASRGPYEGWTVTRTTQTAQHALALAPSGPAAVEAHSALVHIAALTGQLAEGRRAVAAMYSTAGPDIARPASFDNYLECRLGSLQEAHNAYVRTGQALATVPLWQDEATIYLARAMVKAGDVNGGARLALKTIGIRRTSTRILGMGIRDVLSAVPADTVTESTKALRGYASPGPAPWETIR